MDRYYLSAFCDETVMYKQQRLLNMANCKAIRFAGFLKTLTLNITLPSSYL